MKNRIVSQSVDYWISVVVDDGKKLVTEAASAPRSRFSAGRTFPVGIHRTGDQACPFAVRQHVDLHIG
jgi:hypothetical protein